MEMVVMRYQTLKRRVTHMVKEYQDKDYRIWIFATDEEYKAKKDQIKPYHKVIQIRPVSKADLCTKCKRVKSVCGCY